MEEHFKNKLKNHKVDWDKEELLGSIQQELSQSPTRFDKRWLLLLPLLFISTCWGLLEVTTSPEKGVAIEHTLHSVFDTAGINTTDSSEVAFNKTENQITTHQLINRSSDKNQITKLNRSLSNVNNPKINDLDLSTLKSSIRITDATNQAINKESISEDEYSESTNSTIYSTTRSTTRLTTTETLPTVPNSITSNTEDQNKNSHTELLPLLEIALLVYENEILSKPLGPIIGDVDPEQKADIKSYFFTSVLGNIGLINRSISALPDGQDHSEELKLNEESINSLLLLSTDLTVGYQHQSGWSLESGLEYNRTVESFNFVDTLSLDNENVEYEKAFYFLFQSDTLFYNDSVAITNAEIRKVRHNNYHSYFNIPLIVGYRYTIGSTNIFGSVGISYAFANTFTGRENQILDGGEIVVVDNPSFDLKNRIGLSLGLVIEYPLSQRTHIFSKMAYQRTPKLSRGVIDQIYQSYSLGVGIKVIID